jgi:hypothetical protein
MANGEAKINWEEEMAPGHKEAINGAARYKWRQGCVGPCAFASRSCRSRLHSSYRTMRSEGHKLEHCP